MIGALQNARRTKDARETLTPDGILCQNARRHRRMLGADQYFTLFTLFVNISIFVQRISPLGDVCLIMTVTSEAISTNRVNWWHSAGDHGHRKTETPYAVPRCYL